MTNECSVCLDEISQTTGSATMACGHCFHIGCLGRWLTKTETCPYCRHEANEHERIEEDKERDEESEYEEDNDSMDEEDENESYDGAINNWIRGSSSRWINIRRNASPSAILDIPEYDDAAHALWVFRTTMDMLENGEEIRVPKVAEDAAVRHIQAVVRGHQSRLRSLSMDD